MQITFGPWFSRKLFMILLDDVGEYCKQDIVHVTNLVNTFIFIYSPPLQISFLHLFSANSAYSVF